MSTPAPIARSEIAAACRRPSGSAGARGRAPGRPRRASRACARWARRRRSRRARGRRSRASARELLGVGAPQVGEAGALDDAEERLRSGGRGGERALGPARGSARRRPRRRARGDSPGGHTSSCIWMSAPSSPWTRTASSGGERGARAVEVRPEGEAVLVGVDEARPPPARARFVPSENAWKPPESVSIACGQRVKRVQASERARWPPRRAAASGGMCCRGRSRAPVAATSPG